MPQTEYRGTQRREAARPGVRPIPEQKRAGAQTRPGNQTAGISTRPRPAGTIGKKKKKKSGNIFSGLARTVTGALGGEHGSKRPAAKGRVGADKLGATYRFERLTPEMIAQNKNAIEKKRVAGASAYPGRANKGRPVTAGTHGVRKISGDRRRNGAGRAVSVYSAPKPALKKSSGAELIRKRLTASRMPRMHTVDSHIVRRFPLKLVLLSTLCTLLFMIMIYNNVQINEKSAEVEASRSELAGLDESIRLAALSVEKKNDLRIIEQRALELGMVKADQLEKNYISISSSDQVLLVTDEEKPESSFRMTKLFELIKQKLSGIAGLFS